MQWGAIVASPSGNFLGIRLLTVRGYTTVDIAKTFSPRQESSRREADVAVFAREF